MRMTKEENRTLGQQMNEDTVEVWMTENGEIKSFRVEKNRLFVMGMKMYPEIIDITTMNESSASIIFELLTGSRRYSAQVSMNQAAEIIHVATELKFVNLLKIMEKDLIGRTSTSMEQAVDSLSVALKFGMNDAVQKLVDEIVFGFLDEQLLMYCKSTAALEMIMNRKSELGTLNVESQAPVVQHPSMESTSTRPYQNFQQNGQMAFPRVQPNAQMHKVILTAAKERFRTIINRPINSFKNGFAWISSKNPRRRQEVRRDDEFDEFLDFDHLRMLNQ